MRKEWTQVCVKVSWAGQFILPNPLASDHKGEAWRRTEIPSPMTYDEATASIEFHRLIFLANIKPGQNRLPQNSWGRIASRIGAYVTDAGVG